MQPLIPFFDRVTINLGPFVLGGFGLLVLTGQLVGGWLSARKLARDGYDPWIMVWILGLVAFGVYVGGHTGHVLLYFPETLQGEGARFAQLFETLGSGALPAAADLPVLLQLSNGLSSYGGFLACSILVVGFARWRRLAFWPHLDAVAYGLVVGWMIARVGCFIAHDHPGIETTFWLGVRGICPGNYGNATIACHDMGLYEAFWSAAMAVYFALADRSPKPPGWFVGQLCLWYAPVRFLLDVFRHPASDARYLGLTPAFSLSRFRFGSWNQRPDRLSSVLGTTRWPTFHYHGAGSSTGL